MEPKLEQQEQDELLFSFLNTDCVDSSYNMQWSNMDLVDPPSPPYSTSSGDSIAHGSGSPTEDFEPSTAVDMLSPDNLWQFMSPIASDDGSAALCNTAFQPILFPAPIPVEPVSPRSSPSASDSEPNKRKRGRKAKISASPTSTTTQLKPLLPSVNGRIPEIAVRPAIAPSPNPPSSGSHIVQVKAEPVDSMPLMPQPLNNPSQSQPQPQYTAQQAAMAKRQERLIKNRAAALLSRKRKREHLNTIEEENTAIKQENDELREQVAKLTAELQIVRNENEELKGSSPSKTSQKNTKATGMVFMIMLFSFALFSLPNGSVNRLTVGGSSRRGLIGSSNVPYYETNQQKLLDGGSPTIDVSPSTEVMVVESIKAHDLQSWIQESLKLDAEKSPSETESQEPVSTTALVQYSKAQTFSTASSSPPLYLYADELSQVVRLGEEHKTDRRNAVSPRVSLLSPLVANPGECEPQQYLQVDMQVISSKIVGAQMIGLKDSSFVPLSLKNQLVTQPSSALGGSHFNNTEDPARKNKRRRSVREVSKRKAKVVA